MDSIPLAKHLGSNDKKIRDKAVAGLAAFLSNESKPLLSTEEMEKLWKGIFYCYWMSDKPLVQQALASELAELLLKIKEEDSAFAFLRGFWQSIVREWIGIDRMRMDKYYMLVRKYIYASFVLLINLDWKYDACIKYNEILMERGGPISQDNKTPTSLTFHLSDHYLEELNKALQATQTALPAPLPLLLAPFIKTLGGTPSNITFKRIQEEVLQSALDHLTTVASADDGKGPPRKRIRISAPDYTFLCNHSSTEPKTIPDGPSEVKTSLLKAVFEQASNPDTRDSSRRKLYAIWKVGTLELESSKSDSSF